MSNKQQNHKEGTQVRYVLRKETIYALYEIAKHNEREHYEEKRNAAREMVRRCVQEQSTNNR